VTADLSRPLRVAIVGCGKIADQHVLAIERVPDCRIVALCDQELLMAKQLGERFGVVACFSDLPEMLRAATPDVVHITTPPQSHFSLATKCLESGSHVYLEKPFTVTADEAEALMQKGSATGGMIPKLQNIIELLRRGVGSAHIIDGTARNALLAEVFTDKGTGTMISA